MVTAEKITFSDLSTYCTRCPVSYTHSDRCETSEDELLECGCEDMMQDEWSVLNQQKIPDVSLLYTARMYPPHANIVRGTHKDRCGDHYVIVQVL